MTAFFVSKGLKMKTLFILFFALISLNVFSKCHFYLEKDEVLWAGLALNYGRGLTDIMTEKGYVREYRRDLSHFEVKVDIDEKRGRFFTHAYAKFEVEGVVFEKSSRCFTQSCAVSDLAKVTNKAMKEMRKKLKQCES